MRFTTSTRLKNEHKSGSQGAEILDFSLVPFFTVTPLVCEGTCSLVLSTQKRKVIMNSRDCTFESASSSGERVAELQDFEMLVLRIFETE